MLLITLAWLGVVSYLAILVSVWTIAGRRPLSESDRRRLTILAHFSFVSPPDKPHSRRPSVPNRDLVDQSTVKPKVKVAAQD